MDEKDKAEVNYFEDIIDAVATMEELYKEVAREVNNSNGIVHIKGIGDEIYKAGAKMVAIGQRLGVYDQSLEKYGQLIKIQIEKSK